MSLNEYSNNCTARIEFAPFLRSSNSTRWSSSFRNMVANFSKPFESALEFSEQCSGLELNLPPPGEKARSSMIASPEHLSVIIPCLNEEACIGQAIESARVSEAEVQPEIIVVDGGSSDRTRVIASEYPGVKVMQIAGGRGAQLNAGVETAEGDWVLFLHADCQLPQGYFRSLSCAATDKPRRGSNSSVWGCFCSIETQEAKLRLVEWGVKMRTKIFHRPYGDQGLFAKKSVFSEGCRFKTWPFLEDLEWVINMKQHHGDPALVKQPLIVSPRRWNHYGGLQTTLLNQLILIGYAVGVPIKHLHWFYNSARGKYTSSSRTSRS